MTSCAGGCRSARVDRVDRRPGARADDLHPDTARGRLPDRRGAPRRRARIPGADLLRAGVRRARRCRCASCRAARSTARGVTPCAACTTRRRRTPRSSWCAARAARSSSSWSTCAPTRRPATIGSASSSARQRAPRLRARGIRAGLPDARGRHRGPLPDVSPLRAGGGPRSALGRSGAGHRLAAGRGAHHLRARSSMAPPPA